MPYVVVAALDPATPPPLGPFLPKGVTSLKDDEIVLAEWPGSPLTTKPGATITLTYYPPEQHGDFRPATAKFKLAGVIPMTGPAADPGLTPVVPGVTDKISIPSGKTALPLQTRTGQERRDERLLGRVPRDAPRLHHPGGRPEALGQPLRRPHLRPPGAKDNADLKNSKKAFEDALLSHLNPDQAGLVFQPVKEQSLKASNGSTDFAGLFLGFSFFLIAAALLLVGLLFRLNLDRRASEFGLLTAVGYRPWAIRRLLLGEGGCWPSPAASSAVSRPWPTPPCWCSSSAPSGRAGRCSRFCGRITPSSASSSAAPRRWP